MTDRALRPFAMTRTEPFRIWKEHPQPGPERPGKGTLREFGLCYENLVAGVGFEPTTFRL